MDVERYRGKPGVWMLYAWNDGPYVTKVWPVLRQAVENNRGSTGMMIGFWPFGMDLREAITWYEAGLD